MNYAIVSFFFNLLITSFQNETMYLKEAAHFRARKVDKVIENCLDSLKSGKSFIVFSIDTNKTVLVVKDSVRYGLYLIDAIDDAMCNLDMRMSTIPVNDMKYCALFDANNYIGIEHDFNVDGFGRMVYFKFVDTTNSSVAEWYAPIMSTSYPFTDNLKDILVFLYKTQWSFK